MCCQLSSLYAMHCTQPRHSKQLLKRKQLQRHAGHQSPPRREAASNAQFTSCRLISLKNTISKQLPNMPKEYIARLVMDRRHRSCAIVAKNGTVLGGITYRPFHAQACLTASS